MKTLVLIGWVASFGGNSASSHYALTHGYQGRDSHLTRNVYTNHVVMGASALVGGLALNALWADHPKQALVLGLVGASLQTWKAVDRLRSIQ